MPTGPLLTLFSIIVVDLIGFGIVMPILPYYAKAFGASAFELSWLMTSYALCQFLLAPVWGRISDRYGRRPVLLASLAGGTLAMVIMAQAQSFAWLLAARILSGVFAANISVALAYVTDVTTEKDRARGMGYIGASFAVGFILGPVIGGTLSHFGYAVPIWFAAALGALNLGSATLRLPEPTRRVPSRASHVALLDRGLLARVFATREGRGVIGVNFLGALASTQLEIVFALFLSARFGYGPLAAGGFLAAMGVVITVIQGAFIGRLTRGFGERRLLLGGTAISVAALLLLAGAASPLGCGAALLGIALAQAVIQPSLLALASFGAREEDRGGALGVFHSSGSLARVVGPGFAGWTFDHVGISAPFHIAAALGALAWVIAFRTARRRAVAVDPRLNLVQPAAPMRDFAEFSAWLEREQPRLRAEVATKGHLLLRGFPIRTAEEFQKTLALIGGVDEPFRYEAGTSPRTEVVTRVYTSTNMPFFAPLAFHSEMVYQARFPKLVVFHCHRSCVVGGETPFSDTAAVYAELMVPGQLACALARQRILYFRHLRSFDGLTRLIARIYPLAAMQSWQHLLQTDSRAEAEALCRSRGLESQWLDDGTLLLRVALPSTHIHPETGRPVWLNSAHFFQVHPRIWGRVATTLYLAAMRLAGRRIYNATLEDGTAIPAHDVNAILDAYERHRVQFSWYEGDLLVLDNMLTAHGRNRYLGSRTIWVGLIGARNF